MAKVLCIHGNGGDVTDMYALARHLDKRGHVSVFFGYQFHPEEVAFNEEFLQAIAIHGPSVIVGYSLGGLIPLRHIKALGEKTVRKVICLGSPLAGFGSTHGVFGSPLSIATQKLLAEQILLPKRGNVEVASIAGTYNPWYSVFGLQASGGVGDGVVREETTRITGLTAHTSVRESHSGLPFSPVVAGHINHFIDHSFFLH